MRVLVEKTVHHREKKRTQRGISYYEIRIKGIWKKFLRKWIFAFNPQQF